MGIHEEALGDRKETMDFEGSGEGLKFAKLVREQI
jgi:hypothetical protein